MVLRPGAKVRRIVGRGFNRFAAELEELDRHFEPRKLEEDCDPALLLYSDGTPRATGASAA
jgi:hypothetical protein